jgi:hypothetical protein
MTLRHWNRSANQLGDRQVEELLRLTIEKMWPQGAFPFNIDVLGGQGTSQVEIRVWNDNGVDIRDIAYPEEYLTSPDGATFTAVISKITELQDAILVGK